MKTSKTKPMPKRVAELVEKLPQAKQRQVLTFAQFLLANDAREARAFDAWVKSSARTGKPLGSDEDFSAWEATEPTSRRRGV